ncbi:S8 family serine peptidase [Cerasicoccus maritimus]|uniref:S8 family serine peptidase n=1 Tax=Cerasicoccus maritimus TaxID=490089 RepID=UPI0028526C99|nr:S8 family serine peptidase [Cerasicoccus maritimus]
MRRFLLILCAICLALLALWRWSGPTTVGEFGLGQQARIETHSENEASETQSYSDTLAKTEGLREAISDFSRRDPTLAAILSRSTLLDTQTNANSDGSRVEKRLYHTPEKYPHWRVETTFSSSGAFVRDEVVVADHLIVRAPIDTLDATVGQLEQADLTIRRKLWAPGHLLVSGPEASLEALEIIQNRIQQSLATEIDTAQADTIVFAVNAITPNDPKYGNQWMHDTLGNDNGPDINSPDAWGVQATAEDVVVAVIDSGIDHTHVDLTANMWINSGEVDGNGIDDDQNGLIDDYYGYDFYNDDGDPYDDNKHGTHCAGIIAAAGNNGVGISGVAWESQLMGLKFLSSSGSGSLSDALNCIYYSWFMGADVSSNSWGASGDTPSLLSDVIRQAGIPFIAAAGNDGEDTDTNPHMPASDDEPNIISVAAHRSSDALASFSNYGATTVDLSAPGQSIYSTLPGNRYGNLSGTSMATPVVAGAVALLLQHSPGLSTAEVKAQLLASVTQISYLEGKTMSGGRLNVANLLGAGAQPPEFTSSTSAQGYVGEAFYFALTADNEPTSFAAEGLPSGLSIDTETGEISGYPTTAGEYSVTLTASNDAGDTEQTWALSIGSELDLWVTENLGEIQSLADLETQDANDDGVSDIINYATGSSLSDNSRQNLPEVETGSDQRPVFTFRRREGSGSGSTASGYTIGGVTYTVWCSEDMQTWNTGDSYIEQIDTPTSNGDGTESVTVAGITDANFCFYRLEVTLAE